MGRHSRRRYEAREALGRDWKERWQSDCAAARRRSPHRAGGPRAGVRGGQVPREAQGPTEAQELRTHTEGTRKIGLRAFLHQRRVPEVLTPGCSCGDPPETPEHLLISCRETAGERRELPELRTRRDYEAQIDDLATAGSLARWMLRLGRPHQFDLAESLRREEEAGSAAHGGTGPYQLASYLASWVDR